MSLQAPEPGPDGRCWQLRIAGKAPGSEWQWRHFDLVHQQSRADIASDPHIPEFARAVLIGTDESPRLVTDGSVVAGVIPAYARSGDAGEFEISSWHFVMTQDDLITGRRRANRTLAQLWDTVQNGRRVVNPTAMIDLGIAEFAREARARLNTLTAELDRVEDWLVELRRGASLSDISANIGPARRESIGLKRALAPLARALEEDEEELPDWGRLDAHDAGLRSLHAALDDIAALSDRARSMQDELTTRLAEETNRRLYAVSILTALLLPATFVTGFFGMNTGGLPWGGEGSAHGTIYAGLISIGAVLGTLLFLRWARLLR